MIPKKILRPFAFALILSFCGQSIVPLHTEIQEIEIAGDAEKEESKENKKESDKLNQKHNPTHADSKLSYGQQSIHYYTTWAPPAIEISDPPPEVG